MKGNGKMARCLDRAAAPTLMGLSIMVSGEMTRSMDRAAAPTLMGLSMMGNGEMAVHGMGLQKLVPSCQ